MPNFKAGQFIRFLYNRPPQDLDEFSGDKHKEIFVLNPQWLGEVHGIDLKRLTVAEREVLATVFDPTRAQRVKGTVASRPPSPGIKPLVDDILRRMDPRQEILNPMSFYQKFVKPFLKQKDAYRRYKPTRMQNITVSRQSTVLGQVQNPKPLFHKVESKPKPTPFKPTQKTGQQPKPGSEHGKAKKMTPDEIAALAKKMGVKVATGPKKPPMTQAQRAAATRAAKKKKGL